MAANFWKLGLKKIIKKTLLLPLLLLCLWVSLAPYAMAAPPFKLPNSAELSRLKSALIETSEGQIYLELYPEIAPWHVANFKYLADKGYYKNTLFNIYQPGYIVQGGAKSPSGKESPGYTLEAEFGRMKHERGSLGMARLPDIANPQRRSHGAQFHILLSRAAHMDSNYTIFGKIVNGYDVLDRIRSGSKIYSITVFVRKPELLYSQQPPAPYAPPYPYGQPPYPYGAPVPHAAPYSAGPYQASPYYQQQPDQYRQPEQYQQPEQALPTLSTYPAAPDPLKYPDTSLPLPNPGAVDYRDPQYRPRPVGPDGQPAIEEYRQYNHGPYR